MTNDPAPIPAWQRLNARTTTSGRLGRKDVAVLAGRGVRHVINLALADSPGALDDEAGLMAAAGIRYTHIPVPFEAPQEQHYEAFVAAYEADRDAVHVHCIMNWRVSAFFYRYHRAGGMDEAAARQLMLEQWDPASSDDPRAAVWQEFISGGFA